MPLLCCCSGIKYAACSPAGFEKLLKKPDVQLIDVRHQDEYDAGHIGEAVLIDVTEPDFSVKVESFADKSKPVAVYCKSGRRSKNAADLLISKGFKVYELKGGYDGWVKYKRKRL